MTARLDKHGQTIRIGDRVRLPSSQDGYVRGFGWSGGQERAIVQYHLPDLDQVRLPACLLEKLPSRDSPSPQRPRAANPTVRRRVGYAQGENHYRARLSDKQVREMRELHLRAKKGYETLALIFGCGASTARDICTRRSRQVA